MQRVQRYIREGQQANRGTQYEALYEAQNEVEHNMKRKMKRSTNRRTPCEALHVAQMKRNMKNSNTALLATERESLYDISDVTDHVGSE